MDVKQNIMHFAATDRFIVMFLQAVAKNPDFNMNGSTTAHRDDFDPELVAMYEDDYLAIPTRISCTGVRWNLENGLLCGHAGMDDPEKQFSFNAQSMVLQWTGDETNVPHRDDGPAVITLSNYTTQHTTSSLMCGFSVNDWDARWYRDGKLKRPSGPHILEGEPVSASMTDGVIHTLNQLSVSNYRMKWNHPSDNSNITKQKVIDTIAEGQLQVNLLSCGESVFESRFDEAAFYATI